MKYALIELNEAEQMLAKHIAEQRYQNARTNGVTDGKMGNQSNEQTDLEGMAAEIAFCKFYNVYPDLKIDAPNDLPVYDAISPKGATIDVKSTTYPNGRLLAVLGKAEKRSEIYVLVTGNFPVYCVRGYATAADLFKESNINDLGHGRGYCLDQSQIRKFR